MKTMLKHYEDARLRKKNTDTPTVFSTVNKTLVLQQGIKIPEEESHVSWNQVAILPLRWSCMNLVRESLKFEDFFNLTSFSVQFSHSLRPHEPKYARPPYPTPTPGVYPNSCPLSQWCHPTISSSVIPFSSCPQSFPASGSFQMSQLFTSGGQSIGVSASTSVSPMNTQDWSPLGWTGWISLQSKGLSKVFSNTMVQKHQFFGTQFSL